MPPHTPRPPHIPRPPHAPRPVHRPILRPRPGPRFPRAYDPYYAEPVQLVAPEQGLRLPWRVIANDSLGHTNVLFQSASLMEATAFFKSVKIAGLNTQLELQLWTGSEWKTKADRNNDEQLGDATVDKGIFAIVVVLGLAAWVMLS